MNSTELNNLAANIYQSQYEEQIVGNKKENDAQRIAIRETFKLLMLADSDVDTVVFWRAVQAAHIARKAGIILETETIDAVISANQSWNKSSGHAAEEFFTEPRKCFEDQGIEIVLQRALSILLVQDRIANPAPDITLLRSWINSSSFDAYAIFSDPNAPERFFVFGCVQSKTSIRDRVTRDREPSMIAMNSFFWSIACVIDGDFLRLPKFRSMVNGGTADFRLNGWHGMYVLSLNQTSERIYKLDRNFDILAKHAAEAKAKWIAERQWFNNDWMPG